MHECSVEEAWYSGGSGNRSPENPSAKEPHQILVGQVWKRVGKWRMAVYELSGRSIWKSNLTTFLGSTRSSVHLIIPGQRIQEQMRNCLQIRVTTIILYPMDKRKHPRVDVDCKTSWTNIIRWNGSHVCC